MARAKKQPAADERLEIRYVELSRVQLWERNPKKHDEGAIWKSIQQHGFKDPPRFEPKLNGGQGGIVAGNGRAHVLHEMQVAGEPAPRGVVATEDGWLIPVLFGVDAASEKAAEAYGVDANNLTLLGGDFGPLDLTRMWDEAAYAELLADLANSESLPVSVDGDDVDALIARMAAEPRQGKSGGDYDSFEQTQHIKKSGKGAESNFGVLVLCEGESDQQEVFEELKAEGYEVRMQGAKPPGVKR